jgi:glutathione S-transferase
MLDRIFDNHVMTPVQAIVAEHIPFLTPTPDQARIARSRAALDKIYPWLNDRLAGRQWSAGETFSLADCAGAPSLFYADWVQPIPHELTELKGYRDRVLARPSVARAVDEARPYRHLFPLGAPDRD